MYVSSNSSLNLCGPTETASILLSKIILQKGQNIVVSLLTVISQLRISSS